MTNKELSLIATAIGSLPHTDTKEAIDLVFDYLPDCPPIPQLANVNAMEDMTAQFSEKIPGIVFDKDDKRWYMDTETEDFWEKLEEFYSDYSLIIEEGNNEPLEKYAVSNEFMSSMEYFLKKISEIKPKVIKGQIIGPFTYATTLVDRDKKCAYYDETLKDIIIKGLTLKALWLAEQFKSASPKSKIIIFMDEPSISQWGTSSFLTIKKEDIIGDIAEISSVLKEREIYTGVHCCGKSDWSIITGSKVDILNFDAFFFAQSLSLYSKEIENFLEKGGYIAWGIVPTLDVDALESATADSLLKKFQEAVSFLTDKNISQELIINSSLITPSCGAGSLNTAQAQKVMELTFKVAEAVKQKYTVKI